MIRKILVPVRGDGKGDNVLSHAAALARRFKAHVKITHCRARPEDLMPFGVPIPAFLKKQILEQASDVADQEEAGLKAEVHALAEMLKLRMTENPTGRSASASWVEEPGRQVDVIKRHGRLTDIICVAKPDVDRNLGSNTLKSALFNTGRPVMMCPHTDTISEKFGDNLSIAWNGSTEAARAVALTIGLIESASKVFILTTGNEVHGASAEDLLDFLAMRGVKAELQRFAAKKKIGQELLERSKACGADFMVMGAYGDSHEKETIFGGNTQYIVDNANMPVVLVH
jgi:nucleotide-binding universal stress UspA family protein